MTIRDRNGSSAADLTAPVTQTIKSVADGMRQAITTSYRGPTDSRGSRVIARCDAMRITVPWNHALDAQGHHAAAALQLMVRLGWHAHNTIRGGATAGGGYAFVQVEPPTDAPTLHELHELALSMDHADRPEVRSYGAELRRRLRGK